MLPDLVGKILTGFWAGRQLRALCIPHRDQGSQQDRLRPPANCLLGLLGKSRAEGGTSSSYGSGKSAPARVHPPSAPGCWRVSPGFATSFTGRGHRAGIGPNPSRLVLRLHKFGAVGVPEITSAPCSQPIGWGAILLIFDPTSWSLGRLGLLDLANIHIHKHQLSIRTVYNALTV